MKVLIAHNAYKLRGGEDIVAEAEAALLLRYGHEVVEYRRHNDELSNIGAFHAAFDTLWSRRTVSELRALLVVSRPDVLHMHNTFPLISPSAYWAASQAGVPVVQTLHNFRLMCPQAMLLREGKVCESCVGRLPLPGVFHGCYRGSRAQTGVLAASLTLHRALGTWSTKVDRYIALNRFCRDKFVQGGMPGERIEIKPNFVDPPVGQPRAARRSVLFVGRLSHEKGVSVLAHAMREMPAERVRIAGTGPDEELLLDSPALTLLGSLKPREIEDEMLSAIALVLPSIWYENFPRTLVEAFSCGLPAIASRIGALAEIVEDGVTGLLFEPGDPVDLREKVNWALAHPERMAEMGANARIVYQQLYAPERNCRRLIEIYSAAIGSRAGASARSAPAA